MNKDRLYKFSSDISIYEKENESVLYNVKENWELKISNNLYEIIYIFLLQKQLIMPRVSYVGNLIWTSRKVKILLMN